MAGASEAVRRLSYKVDSDDAVRRIGSVQAAQKGVTAALNEGSAATGVNEARTAKLHSRYDQLIAQQRAYQAVIIRQAAATVDSTNAMTAANDNYARSTSHVSDVLRVATKTAVDHAASWLATAGAVGAGVLIFGSLLAILGPIILAYKVIKEVVTLAAEAWDLGAKKLAEYRDIATKAAAVDLSTDYFQRITKSATDAKLPVDDLTAALKKLADVSTEKLGGSALQTRMDQLTKAGNFQGNTGVDQLAAANTQEQKFRAITTLIDHAMQKGERLAALDLAGTALGPVIAENLRKDSEYLNKMQASADKLAATEIVSAGDVGRALELQARYDAAVKILEQRWHPIQDLLTSAGVKMQAAWVGIVEAVANAVDWVTKLVMKIGEIPQTFWDYIKKGANIAATGIATVAPAIPMIGPVGGMAARAVANATSESPAVATDAYSVALVKLRAGLQNTNAVQQQVNEANTIATKVYGDTSKATDDAAKKQSEARDQYDRARDAIEKHTARLVADKDAVGLGVGAQEELRAKAALTTAAFQAKIPVTAELTAEIDRLSKAAGGAAVELEKAKIASQIDFNRQTAFLSPQDVAIAQQLKGLYGNDVPAALASSEAAAIRFNGSLKNLGDAAANFGENLLQAVLSGKTGIEALIPALSSLGSALTKVGTDSLKSGLSTMLKGGGLSGFDPVSLGIGAAGTAISLLTNMLTQQEADAKAAADAIQQAADRAQGYMDRIRKASIDTSTLLGELQAFDVDAERERAEEAKNGTRNLVLLEQTLASERTAIAESGLKDAQKQFDALVQGARSATTESIKSLTDATTSLATALTVLGQGIAGLSDDVAVAVAKLQSDFASGLMDKINEAYGTGYLTQIAALIRQRASDMSDATKLGISPALVDLAFKSQVQKTIDDAQLTGVAFQQVLAAFPQLAGQVHEFSAAAADTTDTLQQTITTLTDFMRKISDFRKSLLVNNTLSTLSPADQLTEAQRQFRDTLALANSGDVTAQGNLQSAASTYLDQAKSFFASSTEYATIFREVQDSLLSSESAAQQQINYAVAQVSWLEQQTHIQQQQLNWLIELNNAVASLSATIAAPAGTTPAASDVNAAAVAAAEAAKTWHYPTVDPYLYGDKGDWTESHRALYRADHPEARYQLGGVIPGMAGGGMVGNGTYGVDSVRARYAGGGDIALAGGEYVMPANQTRQYRSQLDAMRSGTANDNMGSDNGAHFRMLAQTNASGFNAVVSALREEIGELRAEIRRGNSDARIAAKRPATPGKAA